MITMINQNKSLITNPLKLKRLQALLSQRELAKKSGVSQPTICSIETGKTENPSDLVKYKLAKVFICEIKELFYND